MRLHGLVSSALAPNDYTLNVMRGQEDGSHFDRVLLSNLLIKRSVSYGTLGGSLIVYKSLVPSVCSIRGGACWVTFCIQARTPCCRVPPLRSALPARLYDVGHATWVAAITALKRVPPYADWPA